MWMLAPEGASSSLFLLVSFLCIFTFINYSKYVQNVMCMSNVTIRVPEELKGRMKRCKSVNWSEVARKAFEDAARKQEMQCAAESIKNLIFEWKSFLYIANYKISWASFLCLFYAVLGYVNANSIVAIGF